MIRKSSTPLSKRNVGPKHLRNGKLTLTTWFDKKLVNVLSTTHGSGLVEVHRRGKRFQDGKALVTIPRVVHHYNQFMGGVDLYDKKWKYESYHHKSNTWAECLLHLCIEVALMNSHIIWQSSHKKKIKSKEFRLLIADELCGPLTTKAPLCLQPSAGLCVNPVLQVRKSENGSRNIQSRCEVCWINDIQTKVTTFCSGCGGAFCDSSRTTDLTCFQKHFMHGM